MKKKTWSAVWSLRASAAYKSAGAQQIFVRARLMHARWHLPVAAAAAAAAVAGAVLTSDTCLLSRRLTRASLSRLLVRACRQPTMKLKRFLLRYYPPGIILEYEQSGEMRNKHVDLLDLTPETDVEVKRLATQKRCLSSLLIPPLLSPPLPSSPPPPSTCLIRSSSTK